ncbi:MAG: acetate kinase [Candidatus Omnitrophota bacterium]
MLILVVNSGSSSVKYQLYDMPKEVCLAKGMIEKIGQSDSVPNHKAAITVLIQTLLDRKHGIIASKEDICAVGHRVVHGGEAFKKSTLVTKKVVQAIEKFSRLAPLHNPPNLAGIVACMHLFPAHPQVAVFDTAFHQSMPERAYLYGLPYALYKKYGIRRYGFHGTSHRYVSQKASELLGRPLRALKLVTCHLGNGCSIAAVDHGKSVDTSMGFTPLEGLVMGTRCGDIDAAAVLYLMREEKMSTAQADELLNKKSGLLGISGKSNDMRDILLLARKGNRRARLALEIFIYRIKKYIGEYIGVMDGCDAIIFTAGIGENVGYIRQRISRELSVLLRKLHTRILVVPTNEELMIARDTYQLVAKSR